MDEWVEPFVHIMSTTVDTKPLDAFNLMFHAPNYPVADLEGFVSTYHVHRPHSLMFRLKWNWLLNLHQQICIDADLLSIWNVGIGTKVIY